MHQMNLIRMKEVVALTTLSKATIYRRIKDAGFPKSVSLGGTSIAWIKEEVVEWLKSRIAMRDAAG